ncbi:hypothetical protein H5410_010964 [Solanum commersonii]|uniref:Uncharacterized protein n=1 Tax=Solanum commersonii TaxID=4109 RepID=A0A9J6ANN5_SOLCO|nr:hypothetical protein H5410_010964 [Solanum commersonii]
MRFVDLLAKFFCDIVTGIIVEFTGLRQYLTLKSMWIGITWLLTYLAIPKALTHLSMMMLIANEKAIKRKANFEQSKKLKERL